MALEGVLFLALGRSDIVILHVIDSNPGQIEEGRVALAVNNKTCHVWAVG
jgi:hypothetical protein